MSPGPRKNETQEEEEEELQREKEFILGEGVKENRLQQRSALISLSAYKLI